MRILLLDNYDSFTYNLYDLFLQTGALCTVWRNDDSRCFSFDPGEWDGLAISPGPGRPEQAGELLNILKKAMFLGPNILPVLGICLGHQAIGELFGAKLVRAAVPVHGKTSLVTHVGHPLFEGIPTEFRVMRYHSLILEDLENTLLQPLAYSQEGELMAMAHNILPVWGVQFHPESVLTEYGGVLIGNWLRSCSKI